MCRSVCVTAESCTKTFELRDDAIQDGWGSAQLQGICRSAELDHSYTSGFSLCLLSPGGQLKSTHIRCRSRKIRSIRVLQVAGSSIDRTFQQLGRRICRGFHRYSRYMVFVTRHSARLTPSLCFSVKSAFSPNFLRPCPTHLPVQCLCH